MSEIERATKISWVLDFMQTDWGSLSEEDKEILKVRLSYFYRSLLLKPTDAGDLAFGPEMFKDDQVVTIQSELKEFFHGLLKPPPPHSSPIHIDLPPIRRALAVSNDDRFKILRRIDKPIPLPPRPTEDLPAFGPFGYGAVLVDYIGELLIGLPKDSIKRCMECQRLFFHISKKKKIYCSSSCSWKSLSRERREAIKKHPRQYQAYLKKQRETMKKYYEKKGKSKPEVSSKFTHYRTMNLERGEEVALSPVVGEAFTTGRSFKKHRRINLRKKEDK